MKIHKGNMWKVYKEADYFVFTGNSFIKTNHALIMGRGMAKQVRDRIPGIDIRIGKHILKKYTQNMSRYGFMCCGKICVFQVKQHYIGYADESLIEQSVELLCIFANKHPSKQIHMNYPGIGCGGLTEKIVFPIIKHLPDNVHIWKYRDKNT